MAKLNWNRPNGGYEMEPWDQRRFRTSKSKAMAQAIHKEEVFISGKYWNKNIGTIVKQDPGYCDWVLANNPTSVVAKQIIKYFNRHPAKTHK